MASPTEQRVSTSDFDMAYGSKSRKKKVFQSAVSTYKKVALSNLEVEDVIEVSDGEDTMVATPKEMLSNYIVKSTLSPQKGEEAGSSLGDKSLSSLTLKRKVTLKLVGSESDTGGDDHVSLVVHKVKIIEENGLRHSS
ncbi:hypothetical protein AQUCO_00100447v1 [Aquilegia coerulea]|uniref:Uncharacterized protein n=1 Tax=Aquilegia coerulea TaxID=218851 RepID=A0A2G5FAK8_AQUCA|nr:hypothetical protein AQUCO_00100447v1 [Aquilegia coerulea]